MDGLLRNRGHKGPGHIVAVSHSVTIFVPEPRICEAAAMPGCPVAASAITWCDSGPWWGRARSRLMGEVVILWGCSLDSGRRVWWTDLVNCLIQLAKGAAARKDRRWQPIKS